MINHVRPMIITDLPAVERLSAELGYPAKTGELRERFELLNGHPQHGLFVYDEDGVRGWIHLEAVLDLIEETKVEIKAIVVNESYRGRGIGSQLIKLSKEWAKTYSTSTIYLSCNIIREKAHAFYLREGFEKVKTSHFFEMKI